MLSIGKLTGGAASVDYYEQSVASGREDYYAGEGEREGQWMGAGAEALDLRGPLPPGALHRLLVDGEHPVDGLPLRTTSVQVHAFDLTFSAPKSVSVLFAVGTEHQRAAVVRAHERAVADALAYLEREAAQVRRGAGGTVIERAPGFIAAAYRHRTSRAGDPQLHTHVVTANLARGADGRWTALHAVPLYAHARTAGYLYQAALREQLGVELGVRFSAPVRGAGEIIGIPTAVIEHFSTRRLEIREAMAELGTTSAAAARVAALQTRRAKQHTSATSSIYERWQARAAEHGLDEERLQLVLGQDFAAVNNAALGTLAKSMAGEAGLTAHSSSFTRREVLQEWANGHTAGASVAQLEKLADRWLGSELVVQIDGHPSSSNAPGSADDVRVAGREDRFTTPQMLDVERALIAESATRADAGAAVAGDLALTRSLAAREYLAPEQRAMVTDLVTSGHGVQVVLAKAGSGKTTALDAARDAWQHSGIEVQGAALSSYAAQELRDSGIDATTISRLLMDIQRYPLPRGSVLIIDEAGMVGTRTLRRLALHAAEHDLKLVLVGDDHQLPEIDAGGAFRGLASRIGAIRLQDNRRQHDPEDRRALDAYRAGRSADLVSSLQRRGRLTIGETVGHTEAALVADWWAGAQEVGVANATMIAMRRAEVRELNQLAREQMRAAGRLGSTELKLDEHRSFAVGDHIVTRRPNQHLGVANGTRAEITALAADGSLRLQLHGGPEISLPARYVTGADRGEPAIEHGYAVTAHRMQGGTTQRSYVLGSDAIYREWGYMAFSRHREETRFYITVPELPEHAIPDAGVAPADPLEPVLRGLRRSRAQEMAMDIAAAGELHLEPHESLLTEVAHLREVLDDAPVGSAIALERIEEELSRVVDAHQAALNELQRIASSPPSSRAERDEHRQLLSAERARAEHLAEQTNNLQNQGDAVRERAGDPAVWLADHAEQTERLTRIESELSRRRDRARAEALRLVTVAPPSYVIEALGARPDEPSKRRLWDRGARTIEEYRLHHGELLRGSERGLGPIPMDKAKRRAFFAADRQIRSVQIALDHAERPAHLSIDR